ncbi:hypothetical protein STEG23_009690 [Scotinomys teguina]
MKTRMLWCSSSNLLGELYLAGHEHFLRSMRLGNMGPRSSQSPLEEEDQEQTVTEEEDPGADKRREHVFVSSSVTSLGPRSSQSPSEEEDQGAASHPQRKRTQEHPDSIGPRDLPLPPM